MIQPTESERLKLALDAAQMGVWDWDIPSDQIYWNHYNEMMLGYEPGKPERTYQEWATRVHPEDLPRIEARIEAAIKSREDFAEQYRVVHPDGSLRWVEAFGRFYYDSDGKPCRMVGMLLDATRRKVAESALLESERREAALAKVLPVGVFRTDKTGKCSYVNERWCEITGLTPEEAMGDGWVRSLLPDDRERLTQRWQEAVQLNQTFQYEYRFQRPDGVVTWVLGQAIAEGDEGFVGTTTDITDRKQWEASLQESEARFRLIADSAPMLLWMSDTQGKRNFFNKGWLQFTGRAAEKELGNGWTEAMHPEDYQPFVTTFKTAFDARQGYTCEYRLLHIDGEYRWILETGVPRHLEDGQFSGYIGSCLDITERKRAEVALTERANDLLQLNQLLAKTTALLEKQNQELDQFAYVASHDLKAPLRAIANLSEWLEEDLQGQLPDENRHQLDLLRSRVHRMEALIDGLLQYSRVGRTQTMVETIHIHQFIQELLDLIDPPSDFKISIEMEMSTLQAKPLLLRQVFLNLIGNAIKHHNRNDGQIQISGRSRSDGYEFAIADDGPGIASEYHDKIFVIFQTLEARDTKESTGIGLSIVKKIIESEGGKIWVKSALGQGTTFFFTWPRV